MCVSGPDEVVEGIVPMAISQKRTDWQVFSKKHATFMMFITNFRKSYSELHWQLQLLAKNIQVGHSIVNTHCLPAKKQHLWCLLTTLEKLYWQLGLLAKNIQLGHSIPFLNTHCLPAKKHNELFNQLTLKGATFIHKEARWII